MLKLKIFSQSDFQSLAQHIKIMFEKPRTVEQQINQSNPLSSNSAVLEKVNSVPVCFYILERRFHDENLPTFLLFLLHPITRAKN